VVLYVGNRQELLRDEERAEWLKTYGGKALEHLVIDADPLRGVHLRPLDEYVGLLIRHCRAEAITPDDLKKVVQKALGELGKTYDIKHIFRLLFFFIFPWELLPESLRRFGRDFTLSESDTICSRVLSEAFHSVGYPIRPIEVIENRAASNAKAIGVVSALRNRGRTAVRLLAGGRIKAALTRLTDERYLEFHLKASRHITPADYDLSRFFSVIKDRDDLTLDYKQIRMTTEDEEDA
jgi:hypothetical protein